MCKVAGLTYRCRCARLPYLIRPVILALLEKNGPLYVYDTSGVYTDPNVEVDLKKGLGSIRSAWIAERNDTEELAGPSSDFGRQRLEDPATANLRFEHIRKPRRAKAGANVSQMHYATARHYYPGNGIYRYS